MAQVPSAREGSELGGTCVGARAQLKFLKKRDLRVSAMLHEGFPAGHIKWILRVILAGCMLGVEHGVRKHTERCLNVVYMAHSTGSAMSTRSSLETPKLQTKSSQHLRA